MSYRQTYGDQGLGSLEGTATSLPAGYTLGEIRWNGIGTKKYRLMYNAGGASIPTDRVVARAFGGTSLYSVTVSCTTETGNTLAAGLNAGGTIPTASYFWGAVYGHPFTMVSGTVSIATDAGVCMEGTGKAGNVMLATTPSANMIAQNIGDYDGSSTTGIATAMTGLSGGRFFLFFEDIPAWAANNLYGPLI